MFRSRPLVQQPLIDIVIRHSVNSVLHVLRLRNVVSSNRGVGIALRALPAPVQTDGNRDRDDEDDGTGNDADDFICREQRAGS